MSVQKYKPVFESGKLTQDSKPFAQILNKTLQECRNLEALAIWCHLQSRSESWTLNPHQLRKHFQIGKDKIYSILNYLIRTNLLIRNVQLSAKGTHISTTYIVLNGDDFLDTERPVEDVHIDVQPLPDNPDPVQPDPVNTDIRKERDLERKEDYKEISLKDYSATEVARVTVDDAFEEFWKIYPVKKNKFRAKKIWERKKYSTIVTLICKDILNRLANEAQWQDVQFIPHASTYLNNERWNDEIIYRRPKEASTGNGSFSNVMYGKSDAGVTYDERGNSVNPFN